MPKILVADDNSNIQKMVGLALKDQGIDVVAVGNGEAAVRKISDVRPDLVLADVFMPVRNGYEVCKYVKNDSSLSHIPVILLVGAFDPLDEEEAQRVGADGVLKKPFVPPDPLISMVKSALVRASTGHTVQLKPSAAGNSASPASATTPSLESNMPSVAAAPDAESFVEEIPPKPPELKIDTGGQPLAFGSLMETPAGEGDDTAFLSTPPSGVPDRDWGAAVETQEEDEEEEDSGGWRRDGGDEALDDGAQASAQKAAKQKREAWTPTREKTQDLLDAGAEPEFVTETPRPQTTAPTSIPPVSQSVPATVPPPSPSAVSKPLVQPQKPLVESAPAKPLVEVPAPSAPVAVPPVSAQPPAPASKTVEFKQQEKPKAGEKPSVSDKLKTAEKPASTDKVRMPDKPAATDKPIVSAKPGATEKPSATAKPIPAETPVTSGQTGAAQKPGSTEAPAAGWFSISSTPWEAEAKPSGQAPGWDAPAETVSTQPIDLTSAPVTQSSIPAPHTPSQGLPELEHEPAATGFYTDTPTLPELVGGGESVSPAAVEALRQEATQVIEETAKQQAQGPTPQHGETAPQAAPADIDALVAKVLAKLNPELLQAVTREILKPVIEAVVRDEITPKKP